MSLNVSYSIKSSCVTLPSLIGIECSSGNIEDCNLSMTMEILPFSCKGFLVFSTNENNECGTKCFNTKSRNSKKSVKRRGWSKWIRYESHKVTR